MAINYLQIQIVIRFPRHSSSADTNRHRNHQQFIIIDPRSTPLTTTSKSSAEFPECGTVHEPWAVDEPNLCQIKHQMLALQTQRKQKDPPLLPPPSIPITDGHSGYSSLLTTRAPSIESRFAV